MRIELVFPGRAECSHLLAFIYARLRLASARRFATLLDVNETL